MKNLKVILTMLAITLTTNAQFDTIIFEKEMPITSRTRSVTGQVIALGDQNSDGYDDILIWDCERQMASIYLGGNPMSTEPYMEIFIDPEVYPYCCGGRPRIISFDINDDSFSDLIFQLNHISGKNHIKVFFAGPLLDNIPDLTFQNPKNNKDIDWSNMEVIEDFNGDGRSELAIREIDNTIPDQHFSYYIYNIGEVFDTTEYKVISPAVEDSIDLHNLFESGDLNGDGYADLSFLYTFWEDGEVDYKRTIIPGNPEWNLTAVDSFYQSKTGWDVFSLSFIEDMNGDEKDDILIKTYTDKYPSSYEAALLYGSIPIDTIEDAGINAVGQGLNLLNTPISGDFNGDGYGDFVTTTAAFPYSNIEIWIGGSKIPPDSKQVWYGGEEGIGRMVEKLGDVDGDGVDDFCFGAVPYQSGCTVSTVYIIKGDTSVTTSIRDNKELPKDFVLNEPYPNPFNPATTISYTLQRQTKVKLIVYDTLGKEVTVLINKEQSAGGYEIEFNAEHYNLSSGVYFVRMIVENGLNQLYKESKKLVLMK